MIKNQWCDDLCEYYGVTPEQAVELGTRKTGRRPNLPGSKTCKPVSGKNFEELWQEKPRETIQQKMDFYKDIGAWQVFRQCNYRSTFDYGKIFFPHIKSETTSFLEYGCGVAPLTNYIIENRNRFEGNITSWSFGLVDVVGEHLEFAKWRLKKKAPDVNFDFYEITELDPVPKFKNNFDICCIMDVFEHLPNPYDVLVNLYSHSKPGAVLVETWREGTPGGPDLEEAEAQRKITTAFLREHFDLIKRGSIRTHRKK